MKYFYKTLLLFLIPIFSLAQSNYKPGYVITLKGDTLRGFIDHRDWDINPLSISFKTAITDNNIKKLGTDNISFFNVDNLESYQKYTGHISMNSTDVNHINDGRDTSFKTATVFLKVLQTGARVTLYSYIDDIKTRFYIKETTESEIKELEYRLYYDYNQGSTSADRNRTVTENTYLKQLLALAQKYSALNDDLQWDIEHAYYNKPAILKITTKINGISKAEFDKKYNEETNLHLFAGVAANITSFSPYGPYQTAGGQNHTSVLPAISFGINVFANPNTGKLIFRVELIAAANQYRSSYMNKVLPNVPISYSYDQFAVALAPQIIYNFYNAPNFKIYAGVGISLSYFNYTNANFGSTDGKTSTATIIQNDPKSFNSYGSVVIFKGGVQFAKNWGIFANYLTSGQVTNDPYFITSFNSIQLGVNYFFK